MKKIFLYTTAILIFTLISCGDDNQDNLIDFSVSFTTETIGLAPTDTDKEIILSYSRSATETGIITLNYTTNNAVYGTDFSTSPVGTSGTVSIPVAIGDVGATLTFTKLNDPIEGTTKSATFSLASFNQTEWINGSTTSTVLNFTPIAATGSVMDVNLGGPNEPNQVFIDLSTNTQTEIERDTWEIAFYNGTENAVFLNSALLIAAAKLEGVTDINSINEQSNLTVPLELTTYGEVETVSTVAELLTQLPVSYFQYSNAEEGHIFTDSKDGQITGTAFDAISTIASENNVYILSLGSEIPTTIPDPGSLATTGEHNGFLKVRVLTDGSSYTIQYAALNATSFTEVIIAKNSNTTKTAFNFSNGATVNVQPETQAWDIHFSGVFSYSSNGYGVTYSDYALHNTLGAVSLYQVTTYTTDLEGVVTNHDVPSYTNFLRSDVDDNSLIIDDQSIIGSGWRNAFNPSGPIVKDDRYFILKDANANYYKLKFTAVVNSEGERGYPQFVYEILE